MCFTILIGFVNSAIMSEDWGAADDTAPVVVAPEVQDIKLFGKWSTDDVQVSDISLTVSALLHFYFPHIFQFCNIQSGNFQKFSFSPSRWLHV